ncbi:MULTISPECIES: M48 family metalloprotease [unclassified Acinetobacter]|uniref:M48 family metalloprotease n=1 Tax=unclassified Acinetobacter TaxID=196816 RepID=UPI001C22D9BA|nr:MULTISPECIES: M48 family metalloprotease [unclassified Acinetobacter]
MKRLALACGLSLCMVTGHSSNHDFNQANVQFSVPDIGTGVGLLDQQKEKMIGEKVYREVHKQMPVMQNPWLEDQLLSVFSHILSQTQLQQPIGLLVINDPQINAFAVPGGLFALNAGLINSARNMDEVAGVMAHEIAHVTQRHYSRSQDAFKGQGLLALAGILVGALVASQADGDVGAAVMMGSQAALVDKQLTYSRNQEREADRIGMQYMYRSGYNPHSMADFFEVMHRSSSRLSFLPDFWFTHPLTTERMSEARLRANQLPAVKRNLNDQDFEIIKWYSRVLSRQTDAEQLILMDQRNNFAGQLALTAYHIQQGDFQAAQTALDQAKKHNQMHPLQVLFQTDIYLGQNQLDVALKSVASAARIMPENRALNYKYAEVLIRAKQPDQAKALVQRFLNANSRDVNGWRLMQLAANAEPDSAIKAANVLRYRAEVEYWSGYEETAIKSLLHAQRTAKNNQSLSAAIRQRLKQMQQAHQYKI